MRTSLETNLPKFCKNTQGIKNMDEQFVINVFLVICVGFVFLGIYQTANMVYYYNKNSLCAQEHNVYTCEQIIEWKPIYSTESK